MQPSRVGEHLPHSVLELVVVDVDVVLPGGVPEDPPELLRESASSKLSRMPFSLKTWWGLMGSSVPATITTFFHVSEAFLS